MSKKIQKRLADLFTRSKHGTELMSRGVGIILSHPEDARRLDEAIHNYDEADPKWVPLTPTTQRRLMEAAGGEYVAQP